MLTAGPPFTPRGKRPPPKRGPPGKEGQSTADGQLKGAVLDVYRKLIPEFRRMPRAQAVETILQSPPVLQGCLQIFHERRELFDVFLVNDHQEKVEDADKRLSCGRSLNEILTLVVRACAKRYFRQRLDPPRRLPTPSRRTKQQITLWQQILRLFLRPPPPRRVPTAGERLFTALRPHLLYEWQISMLPHYSPLPVSTVRMLGADILKARSREELHALVRGEPLPLPLPVPPPPLSSGNTFAAAASAPLPGGKFVNGHAPVSATMPDAFGVTGEAPPSHILSSTGLEPETAWRVWQRIRGGHLFNNPSLEAQRKAVSLVCGANPELLANLFYVVGFDTPKVLVFLVMTLTRLGPAPFVAKMGPIAPLGSINRLSSRLCAEALARETELSRFLARSRAVFDVHLADGR